MKRTKIISVRVNEELYNKVQEEIKKNETKYTVYYANTIRNRYKHTDKDGREHYDKFTIADIVENAFKEFIKT